MMIRRFASVAGRLFGITGQEGVKDFSRPAISPLSIPWIHVL